MLETASVSKLILTHCSWLLTVLLLQYLIVTVESHLMIRTERLCCTKGWSREMNFDIDMKLKISESHYLYCQISLDIIAFCRLG